MQEDAPQTLEGQLAWAAAMQPGMWQTMIAVTALGTQQVVQGLNWPAALAFAAPTQGLDLTLYRAALTHIVRGRQSGEALKYESQTETIH